jgi:hypothetical protein
MTVIFHFCTKQAHEILQVNWWVNSSPKQVVGMGKTAFYGKRNGEENGWAKVCVGCVTVQRF